MSENIDVELNQCPDCGGCLEETGEICKDELSYMFMPIKRRYHFKNIIAVIVIKKFIKQYQKD